MSIDVNSAMEALGVALGVALEGVLNVYDYPADSISAPAAIVGFPEVNYDATGARAIDAATFEVHVLVGKVGDRASRIALSPYMAGSGSHSVKTILEADPALSGAVQSVHVPSAQVRVMSVGGVEYLAATFAVDVLA